MKKIITLCVLLFAMFLGTQSAIAQSNLIDINKEASKKTEALRKFIKFDDDQRDQVYLAIQEYTKAKVGLEQSANIDKETMSKVEKNLENKMKAILTEEQYERYQTFEE